MRPNEAKSPCVLHESCFVSFKVTSTPTFDRQAKALAKKYRSLKKDLEQLISQLETQPEMGVSLGHHCFKMRLAISSKAKGKSGGGRIITNVRITKQSARLIAIYDKSEKDSLSDSELTQLFANLEK